MSRSVRRLAPYLFLLPGGLWLILFFVVPMLAMLSVSLQEGSLSTGYSLTWNFDVYPQVIIGLEPPVRALVPLRLLVTGADAAHRLSAGLLHRLPRRHGQRTYLLLLVILPFFTAFIIRTLSWKLILADNGIVLGTLKDLGLFGAERAGPFHAGRRDRRADLQLPAVHGAAAVRRRWRRSTGT